MHEIWSMKSTAKHISDGMANFINKDILCSGCQKPGLTNTFIYHLPKFLILNIRSSIDANYINLIDEVDALFIEPLNTSSLVVEYNIQTVLIVLEDDQIVYLRKDGNAYLSYNKATNQFEKILNLTTQQTGLSSNWTIFIYETSHTTFDYPQLDKILLDQNSLSSPPEPDVLSIGVVQDLLPKFNRPFKVCSIQMEQHHIEDLRDENKNLNDLVINSHLRLTASTAPGNKRVLALDSLIVSDILRKNLKHVHTTWANYDIILCPIQQSSHWYLLILNLEERLIIEFDTLPTITIPRAQNITRILQILNIQNLFLHQHDIDFEHYWKLAIPTEDKHLQQVDAHSCGVHLLIQAQNYIKNYKFVHIPRDRIRLYRYQLAADILRKAELIPESSGSSVRN